MALAELQVGHKQKGAHLIGQLLHRYPSYPEMLLAAASVRSLSLYLLLSLSLLPLLLFLCCRLSIFPKILGEHLYRI